MVERMISWQHHRSFNFAINLASSSPPLPAGMSNGNNFFFLAKEGDTVLDVRCGSGNLAFLLPEKVGINGRVIALGSSKEQLQTAASRQRERTKACYKNIEWIEGDADNLPFSECSLDATTIGYGLRNIRDRKKDQEEMSRVLKPGSTLFVLDFNKTKSPLTSRASAFSCSRFLQLLKGSFSSFSSLDS
ncbi:hypothetical protein CDL12_23287 [Handroanthus impetiginosus]|uniref:Demethylmenaquinone methyltransferase n=1 Tax=Handroanthus impetiginosus TaxID=429701 RepID=A0A2G9GFX7_9LAMI|nr:hypothetical protein CDL12_23287 [Handroanthus impetiginosus]